MQSVRKMLKYINSKHGTLQCIRGYHSAAVLVSFSRLPIFCPSCWETQCMYALDLAAHALPVSFWYIATSCPDSHTVLWVDQGAYKQSYLIEAYFLWLEQYMCLLAGLSGVCTHLPRLWSQSEGRPTLQPRPMEGLPQASSTGTMDDIHVVTSQHDAYNAW